jgi:malate permease and related proteins
LNFNLTAGYQKIITIILLILIGFYIKKREIISKETQTGITSLLLKIIIPFSVFSSFLTPFEWTRANIASILLITALLYYPIMQFIASRLIYRKFTNEDDKKRLFIFDTTYSNAIFMGHPFVQALFGNEGLFFASVFNLPFNVYLWSIGLAKLTKQSMNKKGFINTIRNPVIISCVLGYTWWIVQVYIPASASNALKPIFDVFNTIGACNTPISMIIIGTMLAEAKIGRIIFDKEIWYVAASKLIVVPALIFFIAFILGFRGWALAIPTIIAAMPTCATSGILAAKNEIHKDLAASIITFTTVLSAVTVPIWLIALLSIIH